MWPCEAAGVMMIRPSLATLRTRSAPPTCDLAGPGAARTRPNEPTLPPAASKLTPEGDRILAWATEGRRAAALVACLFNYMAGSPQRPKFVDADMMRYWLRMNPCASKLLRPITTMFMVASIAGAAVAVADPYKDALAAWTRGEYATAYRLWEPLADQGDPDAQFYLGFMNEYGQGVARNDGEAIRWYRKAADQDHAFAQFRLGDLYSSGEGPPRSDSEAAQWYRLAADQGLGGAQFNLGMMYAKGKGVPQDRVLAHMWLNLVVSELPPLGIQQRNTTIDALDLVASQMSPSQVAEAQQLAFQWLTEQRQLLHQKSVAAMFP